MCILLSLELWPTATSLDATTGMSLMATTLATPELATPMAAMALWLPATSRKMKCSILATTTQDMFPMVITPAMFLMVTILELATLMAAMALWLPATSRKMNCSIPATTTQGMFPMAITPAMFLMAIILEPATLMVAMALWLPATQDTFPTATTQGTCLTTAITIPELATLFSDFFPGLPSNTA